MYEFRSLFVDTFAAYNGGNTARYNSIGYYTAQGAEACDATWVEIDSLPDSTPFAEVSAYVDDLNTQAPTAQGTQEEGTEGAPSADLPTQATPEGFTVITVKDCDAIPMGLFAYPVVINAEGGGTRLGWYTACDFPDRRTYANGPWRTEEEACADVRRVSATYPKLSWYLIR